MIYVVTGFPRSGTSMMMRCLQFAGIEPIVSEARAAAMAHRNEGEYAANPYGFFEPDERETLRLGFLERIEEGRCIKLLPTSLPCLPPRPTFVIWMRRDTDEIRRSYKRAFPKEDFEKKFPNWPQTHDAHLTVIRPILDDRRSIWTLEVSFSEMFENPHRALAGLRLQLDVQKAALAIDPSLYRNRGA